MSYPARLVTDEANEQGGQLCTSHLWRGRIGDHHEALCTGFPNAPQTVRAQIKELGHLTELNKMSVSPENLKWQQFESVMLYNEDVNMGLWRFSPVVFLWPPDQQ